jgi:phasin family protein
VADQTETKVTETKAETPSAAAVVAAATQPVVKAAETVAKAAAPTAKAPARRTAKAAARTTRARKPAKTAAVARKTKSAKPAKQTAKTTRAAVKAVKTGVNIMATRTNKAAETGQIATEQFRAAFGDINARAKNATDKSAKLVEEMADLTRGNVEAMVKSSKIAAKAIETISQDAAEFSRKSFEEASAALKSFAEVKSPTDFFRLQGDFARTAFDAAMAESARLSETVLKLAGDVAQPINNRYAVAAERVKTLAA